MPDPFTVLGAAAATTQLTGQFLSVILQAKKLYETLKNAKETHPEMVANFSQVSAVSLTAIQFSYVP